jgi:sec-independent protein translocase protein TatB
MFGVSITELAVIVVVFLLVVGPEKLPDTARKLGQTLGKFKRTSDSIRREFYNTIYTPAAEMKGEVRREIRAATSLASNPVKPSEPNNNPSSGESQ